MNSDTQVPTDEWLRLYETMKPRLQARHDYDAYFRNRYVQGTFRRGYLFSHGKGNRC